MVSKHRSLLVGLGLIVSLGALAQVQPAGQSPQPSPAQAINPLRPDYELGPNDQDPDHSSGVAGDQWAAFSN